MDQELIMQASMIERQMQEAQQNVEFLEKEILDLRQFQENLNFFDKTEGKDILASLGKGVYAKSQLVDKRLFVEVGSGIIVRKTPEEASKVVEEQLKKLMQGRIHFITKIEELQSELQNMIVDFEREHDSSVGKNK